MKKLPADPELRSYIRFSKKRLQETNFMAEQKLRRIEALAEIVFTARASYRKQKNEDTKGT